MIDWEDMIAVTVMDASHANETEEMMIQGQKSVEPHRSQGVRMFFLGTPTLWTSDIGHLHLISYARKIVKRVCSSMIQARPTSTESWSAKTTSAGFSLDRPGSQTCRSIKETLLNPKATSHADTRLSIEIASLRQSLWRSKGDLTGDPYVQDEPPEEPTDKVRWFDTDVMIAVPLTKLMESEKLIYTLKTNHWDIQQLHHSILIKRAQQLKRRKAEHIEIDNQQEASQAGSCTGGEINLIGTIMGSTFHSSVQILRCTFRIHARRITGVR